MANEKDELESFLEKWHDDQNGTRKVFQFLRETLESLDSVSMDFVARRGVTYSLRAKQKKLLDKELFALVDVIEDSPRWLSVCFYAEMITDPKKWGNCVPGGLLGEDGHCFDVDEYSKEILDYLKERALEAWSNSRP